MPERLAVAVARFGFIATVFELVQVRQTRFRIALDDLGARREFYVTGEVLVRSSTITNVRTSCVYPRCARASSNPAARTLPVKRKIGVDRGAPYQASIRSMASSGSSSDAANAVGSHAACRYRCAQHPAIAKRLMDGGRGIKRQFFKRADVGVKHGGSLSGNSGDLESGHFAVGTKVKHWRGHWHGIRQNAAPVLDFVHRTFGQRIVRPCPITSSLTRQRGHPSRICRYDRVGFIGLACSVHFSVLEQLVYLAVLIPIGQITQVMHDMAHTLPWPEWARILVRHCLSGSFR